MSRSSRSNSVLFFVPPSNSQTTTPQVAARSSSRSRSTRRRMYSIPSFLSAKIQADESIRTRFLTRMTASEKVPAIHHEIEGSEATSQALPSASPDQFLKPAHDGLMHRSSSGGFHGAFHKLFIQDNGCSLHEVPPNMYLRSILIIHR